MLASAARLADQGVRAGDRVLVTGDNEPEFVTTLLALVHLDASLVLADATIPARDLARVAEGTGARWSVSPRRRDDDPLPARRRLEHPHPSDHASAATPSGSVSLDAWGRRDDAAILLSSGTTGARKLVVKSGAAILDNTDATIRALGYRPDDTLAPLLPLAHQYGLSVVLAWWLVGCRLLLAPYHRLDLAFEALATGGATVVQGTPVTYHTLLGLLERGRLHEADLARVRVWETGGSPLPDTVAEAFRGRMHLPLLDGYGLTELGNVALATPARPAGCGLPLDGVDVEVRGADGVVLPAGERGELVVRSRGRLRGYLRDGAIVDPTTDGWYHTGDLATIDADGTVHVLGRDRAVHRLGHTLYPEQLERVAAAHGCEAAVVPLPDERRGVALVFVVADPQGRGRAHWRAVLHAALAPYERPNRVEVVPELPRTVTGKLDAGRLRALVSPASGGPPRSG